MRKGAKAAVIGGVFAALVGGAGYGAFNFVSAMNGGSVVGGAQPVRTGPPDADEVKDTSAKFFAAWEKGQAATAASYTNFPEAASELLTAYGAPRTSRAYGSRRGRPPAPPCRSR